MDATKSKILIVDDTRHVVVLLKHYCSKAGYETMEAYDGKEALQRINKDSPDLVLLDAMMPEMSGFDVCKIVREDEKTKFLPIIMVTALSEIEDRIKALNIGVDDFLTKPVDELLLITKIRSLLKAKSQREELEKVKFGFTSLLIHDLGVPLKNILIFSRIFKQENLDTSQKKYIESIVQNSENMLKKISNFLGFAEIGAGKISINKSLVDLCSIVDSVINDQEINAANKCIKIKKNYSQSIPKVNIDRNLIEQVTVNILNNSIKYSADNSDICIKIESDPNEIMVEIADSGPPLSESDISKIFIDISKLVDNNLDQSKYQDLSLVISKLIIESHGGTLTVESKEGSGNVFKYSIPVS